MDPQRIAEAFPGLAQYFSRVPALLVLEVVTLIIVVIDVGYTALRCKLARPGAPSFPDFMFQRITMLLLLLLAAVLEPLVPTLPLLGLASIYYAFFCARHIVLSAAADDVPIPTTLQAVLRRDDDHGADPA